MRDLAIEALHVLGEIVLQTAGGAQRFEARAALLEALAGDVCEIRIGGVVGRNVESRERILDLFELDVAALRDLPGAVDARLRVRRRAPSFRRAISGRNRDGPSACGWGRDMVLPVWMHMRISCARASSRRR